MKILPCFLTSKPARSLNEEDDLQIDLEDEEAHIEPVKLSATDSSPDSAMIGQKVLFFILIILGAVIALPTIGIFLVKSPPPLQDVYTLGISYYKLLFILNLCAVMLMVGVIAFTTTKLPVISVTFTICLFCSIPLIVGLRHNMTMQQIILDISFFSGWPFFVKPMFVLNYLLLPMGVLFFVFLQIRSGFSRQLYGNTFAGAALFLAVVSLFGAHELSRAGKPASQTSLRLQQKREPVPSENVAVQPGDHGTLATLPASVAKDRQPPDQKGPNQNVSPDGTTGHTAVVDQPGNLPITPDPSSKPIPSTYMTDKAALETIERKLGTLVDSLNTKVNNLALSQAKAEEKRQSELTALGDRVGLLAGKLDALLLQLDNKAQDQNRQLEKPVQSGPAKPGPITTEGNPTAPVTDQALAKVDKQLDTLIEKVQSIQTKTRDTP